MRLKTTLGIALLAALFAFAPAQAQALPVLQIGITGGTYGIGLAGDDDGTTIATSPSFELVLLADYLGKLPAGTPLYLSMAVLPRLSEAQGGDYGSFEFNGNTIDVTADMVYGVPPLERYLGDADGDPGDLSGHGVFETYFYEFALPVFGSAAAPNGWVQVPAYNVEPGGEAFPANAMLWRYTYQVDVTGLIAPNAIHFDLYSEKLKTASDLDRDQFAPFSHDAESGTTTVPEPASLLLMGTGLALAASRLRRRK